MPPEKADRWLGSVSWRDFEIEDVRVMSLGRGAALLTYRAPREGRRELPRVVHERVRMVDGRWWLVFQQQTPPSNSMGCAG